MALGLDLPSAFDGDPRYTFLDEWKGWRVRRLSKLKPAVLVYCLALTFHALIAQDDEPQWQKDIDWSVSNSTEDPGETNCPDQYPYPGCLWAGGRACLMKYAIQSAYERDDQNAFRLTLITQCHNDGARSGIESQGATYVARYLRENYNKP